MYYALFSLFKAAQEKKSCFNTILYSSQKDNFGLVTLINKQREINKVKGRGDFL